MVEFRTEDLPENIKSKSLALGDCPHGVQMVTGTKIYTDFPHLYWNFQQESGRDSSSNSQDLDVSVKVSLFWGLVQGTVDYSHHTSSSRSKNSLIIQSICRLEKGHHGFSSSQPVKGSRCAKDFCKHGPFYVDSVCIGAEASLVVSMDTKADADKTSSKTGGGVKIFGADIGGRIQSYASSYQGNFTMKAIYTSSIGDSRKLQPALMSDEDIHKFISDVQELEKMLSAFPERVTKMDNTGLVNSKYIFEPVSKLSFGPSLDVLNVKVESRVKLENALQELLNVKEDADQFEGNMSIQRFVLDVDSKIKRPKEMKASGDVPLDKVKSVYGDHALNFYRRQLKRLTKSVC